VLGLIVARVLACSSKAAAIPWFADTTLGVDLGITDTGTDAAYRAMDWLLEQKDAIEHALLQRHLAEDAVVCDDLSSSYVEGHKNELARFGYSRDGTRGTRQVELGIVATLAATEGFGWVTALRAPATCAPARARRCSLPPRLTLGPLHEQWPRGGCAAKLRSICASDVCSVATRWPSTLRSRSPRAPSPTRAKDAAIAEEAALDGLYVRKDLRALRAVLLRGGGGDLQITCERRAGLSLPQERRRAHPSHSAPAGEPSASPCLHLPPRRPPGVAPTERLGAAHLYGRSTPPHTPTPSHPSGLRLARAAKAAARRSGDGGRLRPFQGLLDHLAALARTTCVVPGSDVTFERLLEPTPIQRRAFELLDLAIPLRLT